MFIYFESISGFMQKLERAREKGAYFEGSGKKYPEIELPKWMQDMDEEQQS